MGTSIERRLRHAAARLNLNLLLDSLGLCLMVAGVLALAGVIAERLLSLGLLQWWMAPALAGAAITASLVLWFFRRPTRMTVAVEVDRRLGLRARFSTAVAMAGSPDPFAQAAVTEAADRAAALHVGKSFPLRLGRRWIGSAGDALLTALAFFLLPPMDMLGRQAGRDEDMKQQLALKDARDAVQAGVERVEEVIQ